MKSDTHGTAARTPLLKRVASLYIDGFRNMGEVGKSMWLLVLVKLFLIFIVMKLLFFPNILKRDYDTDTERAQAVRSSLLDNNR